jgi:anhydro-N-acetylmuramic acid kinase
MGHTDLMHSYMQRREHRLIGVMSGTSLDGVDAVLVSIKTDAQQRVVKVSLVDQVSIAYTPQVRDLVNRLCIPGSSDINDLTLAHFGLSHWNAAAVNALLAKGPYAGSDIEAVCMHGQTVWHAPNPQIFPGPSGDLSVTGTLQIANPSLVASLTGLPVISDFRSADMAEGGQGAPLAPYIDYLLFGNKGHGVAVQNIGGIGNVTVLPGGDDASGVFAFDTGPGNMIMDAVVALGTNGRKLYDEGGSIGASGTICQSLLDALMEDPYFALVPPKSTGREVYGQTFVQELVKKAESLALCFADIVATATAFTAYSIAKAYQDFVIPHTALETVIVSGGGARNTYLLSLLRQYLPEGIVVTTSDAFGVPDQAREAMAFALMGHESLLGRPSNIPAVTGARKPVVLGTITMQHI